MPWWGWLIIAIAVYSFAYIGLSLIVSVFVARKASKNIKAVHDRFFDDDPWGSD